MGEHFLDYMGRGTPFFVEFSSTVDEEFSDSSSIVGGERQNHLSGKDFQELQLAS